MIMINSLLPSEAQIMNSISDDDEGRNDDDGKKEETGDNIKYDESAHSNESIQTLSSNTHK